MIRWLLAALVLSFCVANSASAQTREVYTIRGIPVDETAPTVIEAREKAIASARLAGARALINKITLASDRAAVGGVSVDSALANRLAVAVDVEEETAGAGRYRGKLAVVFNPQAVRSHLDNLKVPYLDQQAPLGLLVPVAPASFEQSWRTAFGERSAGSLVPFVTAGSSYPANASWTELSTEAVPRNARRAILAELQGRDGAWRVIVSTVTAAGTEPVGATPPVATLEAAAAAVSSLLDENWKEASIIRDNRTTQISATVRYTSLAEWNTLRGSLARSPLVSSFRTQAVAREGALVTFAYVGDLPRLRSDLIQRGVLLSDEPSGIVLRSAVSPSGGQ